MKLTRKTTSIHFRKQTAIHYPGLNKNPAYWGLLEYLLFTTNFDEDTGRILISQKRLAKIEGKESLLEDGNYKAENFLLGFQKDVLSPDTFQWSKWNHQAGYCRTVTKLEFSYEYNLLRIDEQAKKWHSEGRVYFKDGSKFSRAKQIKEREEIEKEAISLLDKARCKEARFLLEYLNNLPPHLFTKMLANLDDARLEACKLKDETKRNCALNTLHSIEDQAKPFYQPSTKERTVRIFTLNAILLG